MPNFYTQTPVKSFVIMMLLTVLLVSLSGSLTAQCTTSSSFRKITNTGGSVTYPGTDSSSAVTVVTTSTGSASVISYCNITNGFRAGEDDNNGSYKFTFTPRVNGIRIRINALSNTAGGRENVAIKINNILYTVKPGNIVCKDNCFGCTGGSAIMASQSGVITAARDSIGNGVGVVLIQGAGLIKSIEYINRVQADNPQGSVFEIFFNNSTCSPTLGAPVTSAVNITETENVQADITGNQTPLVINPFSNTLAVNRLSGVNTIVVYTATGQQVASKTTANSTERINTGAWQNGIYFVRIIRNGKTVTTAKVIKQ